MLDKHKIQLLFHSSSSDGVFFFFFLIESNNFKRMIFVFVAIYYLSIVSPKFSYATEKNTQKLIEYMTCLLV